MENQMNQERENNELYVQSLPEKEYKAYLIAKEHLGSSFSLEKSVGYLKWIKTKEETKSIPKNEPMLNVIL